MVDRRHLDAQIKAVEREFGRVLDEYAAGPRTDPHVCRARLDAIRAHRADLKRLRDAPTLDPLLDEAVAREFGELLDGCDVVAEMQAAQGRDARG